MKKYIPEKLYVLKDIKNYEYTEKIISNVKGLNHNIKVFSESDILEQDTKNKSIMFLDRYKGRFFKGCPKTTNAYCCEYNILTLANGCNMDCSYCILQSYLNESFIKAFVNIDDMKKEFELLSGLNSFFRIGTGELTDSLVFDHILEHSKILVPLFAGKKNMILELKTKSDNIENLKDLEHKNNTVIAWSLAPDNIQKKEELRSATINKRIKAAVKCQDWGYKLAFHLDPIVYQDGYYKKYEKILTELFSNIDAKNIVWISLGGFRCMPDLLPVVEEKFPKSNILYNEMVMGIDKKMRYFRPLRVKMFKDIVKILKSFSPDVFLYFCMETETVWNEVLGYAPESNMELKYWLDKQVFYL